MKNRVFPIICSVLLLFSLLLPVSTAAAAESFSGAEETAEGLRALSGSIGRLPAGSSVSDWTVMSLALSGRQENYRAYLSALRTYTERCYAEAGGLDPVKATEWHRITLTVLALGGDAAAFGEKPDGTPIDLVADGTYAFGGQSPGQQGLNGWIYALMALDASGAEVPAGAKFTREDMLEAIVAAQEPSGGFGIVPGRSDTDFTAMALQALAPYAGQYPGEVEAAVDYLAGQVNARCLFGDFGTESAETSAQVILALCALGIDPQEDSRFCRGEESLLTALSAFRQPDGTFGHYPEDTEGNAFATAQVLLALTAAENRHRGEGFIFDFTGYPGPAQKPSAALWIIAGITASAAAAGICIAGKRRDHGKNR